MLKREIKYEDFNGEEQIDVVYFNLSKPELIELQVSKEGGMGNLLQKIIDTKDIREIINMFKEIILMSYGEKSDDGKRFIKSDELREQFSQTAAFQSLFMELAEDEDAAAKFINGLIPKDVLALAQEQDKPKIGDTKPAP